MTGLKRAISVLLAVIMVLPFASIVNGEKLDIGGHWAEDAIEYMIDKDIASGYSDGTFRPDRKITRAEFIKIINGVLGYSELGQVDFKDVDEDDWFYDEISKAVKAGYIEGYDDNTVRPNNQITRQEAALIIATVFDIEEVEEPSDEFKDASKIGEWAKGYVNALKEEGYIEGYDDGTFRPQDALSRAESATIIVNVIEDRLTDDEGEAEVNKEELKTRITEIIIELYGKENLYTEESWDAYAEAMYAAVEVRDNEDARQTEVNKALLELEAKYAALEFSLEENIINKSQIKGYETIQEAIDEAKAGDVIVVKEGTYELSKQLLITKPVTVKGIGEVVIKAAEDFDEGTYNADKHLVTIDRVEGNVKLENLTVTNSRRTGINVFESSNVELKDIVSKDNIAAGLGVTNSKVVAENLKTSGNAWYGINVDNGSNPGEGAPETEFTLVSGEISEEVQIISDKGGVKVTVPEDYTEINVEDRDMIIWTNRPSENQ